MVGWLDERTDGRVFWTIAIFDIFTSVHNSVVPIKTVAAVIVYR